MVGVKPGDYFLGIIEFFGSLVPGVVLVGVLWQLAIIPGSFGAGFGGYTGSAMWGAFIVAAYIVGQVTSVVSSLLDASYDAIRQIRYPNGKDFAYARAKRLMEKSAEAVGDTAGTVNAFQWAKARLVIAGHDAATAEVHAYEAASKLFRTLVVVAAVISAVCAAQGRTEQMLLAFLAAVICFFPFVDRRYKSTEHAYRLVIAMDELSKSAADTSSPKATGES